MSVTIAAIAARLGAAAQRFDIDVLPRCDSTNAILLSRAEAGAASGTVIIGEQQTAGRGRRGRVWFASADDSLTFSLLWRLAPGTPPSGLSLAVGVAVARALEKVGAGETALKWPNDLLRDGRKLGGVLIELVPGGSLAAVIGIGLNLRLPPDMPADVRATSAAIATAGVTPDVNDLYASLLLELLATLERFAAAGFAAIRPEWMARHAFQDAPVTLTADFGPARVGLCRGADSDGALLLEVDGRVERILCGDVSLRPMPVPT
jgi:BirA family biotin operon repressor/biotin-[acetyl-CoA-carboxylase] ligase